MAAKSGSLTINSDNIFPIIKKWLYSDQDIFYRELISNGCDAITKLKKLDMMGEYTLPEGFLPRIDVAYNPEARTVTITDNGLGMTAEEVEEYITQIAFSGAADFLEQYKDKTNEDQIIGHFGLGFYSAFMVAEEVHIDTLSYKEGAKPVHWECDGGSEYTMDEGSKETVGTSVTLFFTEDCLKYCNQYEARSVIQKYCSFMPVEIYLTSANGEATVISASEKLEDDEVLEELPLEEGQTEPSLRILKRPELLNDPKPLWTKHPNECTREEYIEFYRTVFHDYKEPLFWIHLNMDYPFNLKGILYFPKINLEFESAEGIIKLYNNQVFIADNIKEVIPEFLMLLKGVIDCPDLPLNVSRSALQNDGFVTRISDYITKKVADKLSGMCKTEKEEYEKYWDDISPFIKYGCLKDDKFCEKMTDYILFRNLQGEFLTLPEALDVNKIDPDDAEDTVLDESGNPVVSEETEEEPKEKTIYYITDEVQQAQYIEMFKAAKMDAFYMTALIDQPFAEQLERKNEGIRFVRIDSDLADTFKSRTSKKLREEWAGIASALAETMKKSLNKSNLNIVIDKLKNKKVASVLTVSEESRRMADMMRMYNLSGMDLGGMGDAGETLVLNAAHPLVQYVLENKEGENTALICEQLYDLARLQNAPLSADEMARFVSRSNDIMLLLAK